MTARELLAACDHAFLLVPREASDLVVEVLFPTEHLMPPELPPLLKQHKPEALVLFDYTAEADNLLMASTAGPVSVWPTGCTLSGRHWKTPWRWPTGRKTSTTSRPP